MTHNSRQTSHLYTNNLSRRRFLQGTAAVGAGAMASTGLVPRPALGTPDRIAANAQLDGLKNFERWWFM